MKHKVLCLLLCLVPVTVLASSDLSSLYDEQTLRYWKGRYEKNLRWNFDKLVLGSLTPAERRQLGSVQLDLPLRAPGEQAGDPLVFYAARGRIVMPIQSVKFFDDLAQAWAWFRARDESTEKVFDYIAMLKYRKPSELGLRQFPPPLEALNVPADAWKKDKRADDVAQKILESGIIWIMGHQIAHQYYRHRGYGQRVSRKQAQLNETSADRFANEIMRRIRMEPLGMANYFLFMAYWSPNRADFSSEQAWREYQQKLATHPFTAERMKQLARDMKASPTRYSATEMGMPASIKRIQQTAGWLDQIATILEDPDIQRSIAIKARATDLQSLGGTRVVLKRPAVMREFDGNYRGRYGHRIESGATEQLDVRYVLQRKGDTVSGRYSFGLGDAKLNGIIRNGQLHYEWQWGDSFGRGVMRSDGLGNLNGQWGYDDAESGGGSVSLKRE